MGDAIEEIAMYLRQSARVREIADEFVTLHGGFDASGPDAAATRRQMAGRLRVLSKEMDELLERCGEATRAIEAQDA